MISFMLKLSVSLFIVFALCNEELTEDPTPPTERNPIYTDVSSTNLPSNTLAGLSMDAAAADVDGDGDLDIVIANEFRPNILLINDGNGSFANASNRLPQTNRDSEDVALADFDLDGDIDIVIVSEDDQINEYYINNGNGTFADVSNRIVSQGTSNAVELGDFNGDGAPDLFIGNNGQNVILINSGTGLFTDETQQRLPAINDVTQDIDFGDVDGDGDIDILVGNEDQNRLLLNNGSGFYSDGTDGRIPFRATPEETREVDLGDVDGDGDLDLLFLNVEAFVNNADRQNRLLFNDGNGTFTDVTASNLPTDADRSFTGLFVDVDDDNDFDIITGNTNGNNFGGLTPYRVYINDGSGMFGDSTASILPESIAGRGFDILPADFNRDGRLDIFFASRGSEDQLVIGQ